MYGVVLFIHRIATWEARVQSSAWRFYVSSRVPLASGSVKQDLPYFIPLPISVCYIVSAGVQPTLFIGPWPPGALPLAWFLDYHSIPDKRMTPIPDPANGSDWILGPEACSSPFRRSKDGDSFQWTSLEIGHFRTDVPGRSVILSVPHVALSMRKIWHQQPFQLVYLGYHTFMLASWNSLPLPICICSCWLWQGIFIPSLGVAKAVFSLSDFFSGTWWKAISRSSEVNYLDPLDPRYRKGILNGLLIQFSKVHAHSPTPVAFLNHHGLWTTRT